MGKTINKPYVDLIKKPFWVKRGSRVVSGVHLCFNIAEKGQMIVPD